MPITQEEFSSAVAGDSFYGFPDGSFLILESDPNGPCPVLLLQTENQNTMTVYYDSAAGIIKTMEGGEISELSHPDAHHEPGQLPIGAPVTTNHSAITFMNGMML